MMRCERRENINGWYGNLINIAKEVDSYKRYDLLVKLHSDALNFYIPAVKGISSDRAQKVSSDGRPISLVVAHIMAWEAWQVQVFRDTNRPERLQKQMRLQGFYDDSSRSYLDFNGVNDFNEFISNKYSRTSWGNIQDQAIDSAFDLWSFFPDKHNNNMIDFLENSPEHNWKILPGVTLTIPAGWYLWMVSLEHEAVEHRRDLIGI